MIDNNTHQPALRLGKYIVRPCFCNGPECEVVWAELMLPEDELAKLVLSRDQFPSKSILKVLQYVINLQDGTHEYLVPSHWRAHQPEQFFDLVDLLAKEAGGLGNFLGELRELRRLVLAQRAANKESAIQHTWS